MTIRVIRVVFLSAVLSVVIAAIPTILGLVDGLFGQEGVADLEDEEISPSTGKSF
jgi:hypothetical protein